MPGPAALFDLVAPDPLTELPAVDRTAPPQSPSFRNPQRSEGVVHTHRSLVSEVRLHMTLRRARTSLLVGGPISQ